MNVTYKNTIICIITYLLVTCLISCSGNKNHPSLTKAEQLMESRPDSALNILESISTVELKNKRDKALYGMLYIQALDKNHLTPTNDSLISFSVDYYNNHEDPLRLTISNYYQGRARYNAGNIQAAIISFFKAKEIAESHGFYFWAGMACRGISDIYNGTYNTPEELRYAKTEYDYIKKSKKQPYLNYAINDLGIALRNDGKHIESMRLAEEMKDSANKYQDSLLYIMSLQLKALNLIDLGKYDDSYPILKEVCASEFAEILDTISLCSSLFEIGLKNEAINLLNVTSDIDPPLKSLIRYKIALDSHNYLDALNEADSIHNAANAKIVSSMKNNLTNSIIDYYDLNKKIDKAELKSSRAIMWTIIAFSILFLIVILCVGLNVYIIQKKKIAEKVLLADQLQQELSASKHNNSNSDNIIKSLMSSKYELLEALSSIVLTNNDTKLARKKIADAVTQIINDFSIRSDKIVSLEKKVDSINGNIMTDFKNDLPNLKEVDYRLFLFSVLGLSNATISLFLKEQKIEAVYNRKRRLKDKIKQLEPSKSQRYLKIFS